MAHNVELRKVKETEKLKRQVKLLTAEEAANLVIINSQMCSCLFVNPDKADTKAAVEYKKTVLVWLYKYNSSVLGCYTNPSF